MLIIIHRVNKIAELEKVPQQYGVEVDVRAFGKKIILNHEPFEDGDELETYLKNFKHAFIIFNIKESGIENRVIKLAKKYRIENYFLLDVEPYWIHLATKRGFKKIAIRYSENESLETALTYKHKVEWLWIDVPTKLPLTPRVVRKVQDFQVCLVCPERWNRPEDTSRYVAKVKNLRFNLAAVMTSQKHAGEWKRLQDYYRKMK